MGAVGLDVDVIAIENDWAKQQDDEHYRITLGDPLQIRWLIAQRVEPSFDFHSSWL